MLDTVCIIRDERDAWQEGVTVTADSFNGAGWPAHTEVTHVDSLRNLAVLCCSQLLIRCVIGTGSSEEANLPVTFRYDRARVW